jgi:hypothetical protein
VHRVFVVHVHHSHGYNTRRYWMILLLMKKATLVACRLISGDQPTKQAYVARDAHDSP